MDSTGYPASDEPIRARVECYSPRWQILTIIIHPFDTRGQSETLMRRGQRLEGQARHDLQKGQNIVYLTFGKGGGGGGDMFMFIQILYSALSPPNRVSRIPL